DWESLERLYGEYRLPVRLPSAAWRGSVPLFGSHRGAQVGYATSGCWSPLLKKYIALAHVRSEWGSPGTALWMQVTVEHRPRLARAAVAPIPFFEPLRKRQ
ncbi:MAG TPA: glycine cleavage T C-terminal barrel domain-containing protein, partial [Gemmatimonadaceae bacterium]|nr:glycine cleavage T C-terminal barrel domain-containing protein [Gemmatimonadaceae bacterium]